MPKLETCTVLPSSRHRSTDLSPRPRSVSLKGLTRITTLIQMHIYVLVRISCYDVQCVCTHAGRHTGTSRRVVAKCSRKKYEHAHVHTQHVQTNAHAQAHTGTCRHTRTPACTNEHTHLRTRKRRRARTNMPTAQK